MIPGAQSAGRGLARKNSCAKGLGKGLGSLGDTEEVDTRRGSKGEGEVPGEEGSWGTPPPVGPSSSFPCWGPFLSRRGAAPLRPRVRRSDAGRGTLGGEGHDWGRGAVLGGAPGPARAGTQRHRHRLREGLGRRSGSGYLHAASPSPPASFSVSKLTIENAAA